jgi:hypothetical protein
MFVQLIEGTVKDPERVHSALDTWAAELSPGATGWLGSTAGATDDGKFIAVARFESEDAARANSDRPEQDRWWAETSQLFTDEPTFRDSTEVDLDIQGEPDAAGFVQIIKGRSSDPARSREVMKETPEGWAEFRPDVIGSLAANYEGGDYTVVIYFTSEEEARRGEQKEAPPEIKQQMEEMGKLEVGEPTFIDLKQPWLYSPH